MALRCVVEDRRGRHHRARYGRGHPARFHPAHLRTLLAGRSVARETPAGPRARSLHRVPPGGVARGAHHGRESGSRRRHDDDGAVAAVGHASRSRLVRTPIPEATGPPPASRPPRLDRRGRPQRARSAPPPSSGCAPRRSRPLRRRTRASRHSSRRSRTSWSPTWVCPRGRLRVPAPAPRARTGRDRPVIAFSGYSSAVERTRCLEAGFTAHLVKPVNPEVLARRSRRRSRAIRSPHDPLARADAARWFRPADCAAAPAPIAAGTFRSRSNSTSPCGRRSCRT